jgi:hypothetical protein
MFNPEKLLGGLIGSSTRKASGLGGNLLTSGAALGLIAGVAAGAAEHFLEKPKTGAPPGPPPGSPPGGAAPPGPPPPAPGAPGPQADPAGAPPPPPPGGQVPQSEPPAGQTADGSGNDAVLLIRAMIAAANADGVIDAQERAQILGRLKTVELTPDEHSFIVEELLSPADLETIVKQVTSARMARQVYAVSLLAIEVDTDQERAYMQALAAQTGLDDATVAAIEARLSRV